MTKKGKIKFADVRWNIASEYAYWFWMKGINFSVKKQSACSKLNFSCNGSDLFSSSLNTAFSALRTLKIC